MTLAHVLAVAGFAGLALVPSLGAARACETAAPPGSAIGVIDVARAFEQNPRFLVMRQEVDVMKKACDERLREFGRAIKELEGAIDSMEPESEPRRKKQLLYDLQVREAEGTERLMKEGLEREVMTRELAMYDEIDVAARKVAEAKGVTLVIKLTRGEVTSDPSKLTASALRQRHAAARSRDVLYAAGELDLTADVIKYLAVAPEKAGATK